MSKSKKLFNFTQHLSVTLIFWQHLINFFESFHDMMTAFGSLCVWVLVIES